MPTFPTAALVLEKLMRLPVCSINHVFPPGNHRAAWREEHVPGAEAEDPVPHCFVSLQGRAGAPPRGLPGGNLASGAGLPVREDGVARALTEAQRWPGQEELPSVQPGKGSEPRGEAARLLADAFPS